ncbi:MAG: helix-turn-helix domain-containing protein [Kineosporiaceae bacterium]
MSVFELIFVTSELGDASEPRTEYLLDSFDGVVSTHGGLTLAALSCPGRSAFDAAVRAVTDLETHGIQVLRLHEDLVTRAEIARRAGVTPQNVGQWIRGERHGGFPTPHNAAAGGLYLWHDVNTWLETIGRGDGMRHPDTHECARINGHLATARRLSGGGGLSGRLAVTTVEPSGTLRAVSLALAS